MTVETIYTCDKCAKSQLTPKQFWTLEIGKNPHDTYQQYATPVMSMQVCRSCLEALGIYANPNPPPGTQPVLAIEDLIREIIERATQC